MQGEPAAFHSTESEGVVDGPTRAELQAEVLRFESEFVSRIEDAFRTLTQAQSRMTRSNATRQRLRYMTSALEIALGAIPEKNLLDMLVFVDLVHEVFRDHWKPKVYGAQGKGVLAALETLTADLRVLASRYLSRNEMDEIRAIALDWLRRNPDVVSVEFVRMSEFSVESAAREKELARRISGVLKPVASATAAADQALMLGERGLFFVQRAPSLLREQMAVALQGGLTEVQRSASELLGGNEGVDRAEELVQQTAQALKTLQDLAGEVRPMVSDAKAMIQGESRFMTRLFLGCAGLMVLAGVVYVLSKVAVQRLLKKKSDTPHAGSKGGNQAA